MEDNADASKHPIHGNTAKEILADIEQQAKITEDANAIKAPINAFIKNINELISKLFKAEQERGVRTDLIVTLVVGGLAYIVASVFYLVTEKLKAKITANEYEATFMGMYESAMKDMAKQHKKGG